MRIFVSKQAYGQLDRASQQELKTVSCDCLTDGTADINCESCEGNGVIYEMSIPPQVSAAIEDNLRSQGLPLGKTGTN